MLQMKVRVWGCTTLRDEQVRHEHERNATRRSGDPEIPKGKMVPHAWS